MQTSASQIWQAISTYIPNIIGAILILVLGWIIAHIIASLTKGLVRRTKMSDRLALWIWGEEKEGRAVDAERWIGKIVFYILLLFVLIAVFQALGLTIITEPLNRILTLVFEFGPRLLAAGLLLIIAWILASLLKLALNRALNLAKIDERLGKKAEIEEGEALPLSKSISTAVYWLVFLVFLPAILSTLEMQGILEPVQKMISKILDFLPNVLMAALIMFIGWFGARIGRLMTKKLLVALGADQLIDRAGLAKAFREKKFSEVLSLIIYILILLPVLIAAFNALQLEFITQPASNMLDLILSAVPSIFAALLVIVVAYIIGKVVTQWITNLLYGAGFDSLVAKIGITKETVEGKWTPSSIVGYLILVGIVLFSVIEAASLLGFNSIENLISNFIVFAGHVILGVIIFGFGLFLANLTVKTIQATEKPNAALLATIARISILGLAAAAALREMGLAEEIINLAFGLLLGAAAVAAAIAFGLGGRDFASRQLDEWKKSIESND